METTPTYYYLSISYRSGDHLAAGMTRSGETWGAAVIRLYKRATKTYPNTGIGVCASEWHRNDSGYPLGANHVAVGRGGARACNVRDHLVVHVTAGDDHHHIALSRAWRPDTA